MKNVIEKFKELGKLIAKPFSRVNRLGVKLMILTLIIIVASEILSFTATLIIGFVTGGTTNTNAIIGPIIASVIVGGLLAFVIGNSIMKPLSNLTKATKRVTGGDFTVKLEMDFLTRHTIKELRNLIEDFNKMTEELRSTELFRKDFISNFSHEFKTPLVSIRGFARQLCEDDLSEERRKEFARIILEETEYLTELSANTQLLTNLENRDIITDKTRFSLDEQLRHCMLRLEPQWSAKNIEIDMGGLEPIDYYWNEQLLAHIWNNLFDNAVKFTENGGEIKVCCKEENGFVIVTVKDSGCGIPEDALGHIFEKFYQADVSHAARGNGLGLPLALKIAELCGGGITAESKLGEGTEFTVKLKQEEQK